MKVKNKIKLTIIAVIAIFTISVISDNEQTLSLVSGNITPSEYWNSFNEESKMKELRDVFTEYLES